MITPPSRQPPPAIQVSTSHDNKGVHVGALRGNCRAGQVQRAADSIATDTKAKQPTQAQLHACSCAGALGVYRIWQRVDIDLQCHQNLHDETGDGPRRTRVRSLLPATVTPGESAGGRCLVRVKCEPVCALGNLGDPGVHVGALRRARRGHAGRVERVAEHEVQVVRALRDQHCHYGGRQVAQHAPAMPARAPSHLCLEARMLQQSALWDQHRHHGGRQVAQHAPAMPARAPSHLCLEAWMLQQSSLWDTATTGADRLSSTHPPCLHEPPYTCVLRLGCFSRAPMPYWWFLKDKVAYRPHIYISFLASCWFPVISTLISFLSFLKQTHDYSFGRLYIYVFFVGSC